MYNLTKMDKIKDIVEWLLISNAECRDNQVMLYMLVAEHLGYDKLTHAQLLTKLNWQSVRSIRQRLQMLNNDLRWKSYKQRQSHAVDVRKKMRLNYREKMSNFITKITNG